MYRYILTLALLTVFAVLTSTSRSTADDKKAPEVKKGTVVGIVTNKTEKSIEVKADGEEKARVYVPQWVGGQPAQGGGPDKAILKVIKDVKVGSRVRLEWLFEERARVMKLEVLKAPAEKDK